MDTADPRLNQLVPSKDPCNWTDPALTPADETTTIVALGRTTTPSNAVPGPVVLFAVKETAGAPNADDRTRKAAAALFDSAYDVRTIEAK